MKSFLKWQKKQSSEGIRKSIRIISLIEILNDLNLEENHD